MAPSAIVTLCLLALASAAAVKNPEVVPKIDAIMPEICTLSQGQGNKQVAPLVAQAIEHLRVVPDDAVVEFLDKIRAGQYCADYTKLESLFLDAVAFVGEPGAFKVMAQEVAAGRTTGGRFGLYTIAVNILTKPTLDHVAALTPVFGMTDSNQLLSLAASTVVNRYCTQNADCDQTAPVQAILNVLSAKLDTQCTPDFSNVETTQVLTTLKSVGNIGKITTALFDSVMKCALTEGIETNVQVASTLSLKGVTCMEPVTNGLKSVVLDTTKNTEVRIGSYLAAIHCANAGDLQEVIDQMSSETNKQVQGFILSHLDNLKETNWPLKQNLRGMLGSMNIPNDYMRNILKYSRNVEMSVNAPIVELGGAVDSNIVYTPESYVPRLVNLGLNMNLLGSFINIGEVGGRVEGFDPYFENAIGPNSYLYKEVFGTDSYLYKTPLWSIIEDSQLFMTQKGTEIIKQIQQLIKENNINADMIIKAVNKMIKNSKNVDVEAVVQAFNKVLKNAKNIDINSVLNSVDFDAIVKSVVSFLKTNKFQLPKTDLYAILRAQERAFLSFGGKQNQFTINELVESVLPVIMKALATAQHLNVDTTRTGHINIDYSIPTTSGIPLNIKLTATGVAGIQLINNLNVKEGAVDALLKIIPSLNIVIEGHVSFGEVIDTKFRGNVFTTNGFALNVVQKNLEDFELHLELPEKMELFDIESEVIVNKPEKASGEVKRIESNQCSGIIAPVTGLLVCYKVNVPDLINSGSLPLGQSLMYRVYLEKSDAALKGYHLLAKLKNKPNSKFIKFVAGTYGSADSKDSALKLSYTKEGDAHIVATDIESTLLKSKYELTFTNQPEYKSIQYYTSNKLVGLLEAQLDGSVKLDWIPTRIAIYTGLTKELDEKNRIFHILFDLLNKGDKTAAKLSAQIDLFPAAKIAAEIELPSNAGLRIYKVESITLTSTVDTIEVEARFLKKSPEEYTTTLDIKKSGASIATFESSNTIVIESPLIGFEATKLKHIAYIAAKLPMIELSGHSELAYANGLIQISSRLKHNSAELIILTSTLDLVTAPSFETTIELPFAELSSKYGYSNGVIVSSRSVKYLDSEILAMNSKLSYVGYVVDMSSEVIYFSSKILSANLKQTHAGLPLDLKIVIEVPNVLLVDFYQAVGLSGLKTLAQVEVPALIKPLKLTNEFGISNAFSYSFLTDVTSGEAVVLHVEGPLTLAFSRSLVQQNIDLKISGAFDGSFKVMQGITLSLEKIQFVVDARHTSSPIVLIDIALDRTNTNEVAGKVNVHVPLVIESEVAATISTSLIHSTLKLLVLPSTDYACQFKGYADFNWVENNFKGELFWDDAVLVGLSTKYALDTTAFKFLLQGDLTVTTLNVGFKLESLLASPFELLQGNSGLEFTVTLPSQKMVIAKSMLDIQYGDSQVTLKPLIAIITADGSKYELTSALVAKLLPAFLNFEVTCETTLTTPQLQQITHVLKLVHEDKDQSGKLAFEMILNESVLSQALSLKYLLESAPTTLKETLRAKYGAIEVALVSDILLKSGFEVTHELVLPLESVKALAVKVIINVDGSNTLDFMVNGAKIVSLNYIVPALTTQKIGITFPSRSFLFVAMFSSNQINLQFFPDKSRSDKVMEITLRITPKASAVQFEALLTSPSLTKEMRFAVELELIEPGKAGYDMVSIDVQYQVSEALELVKAILGEVQGIYGDLVNDGLLPDFNKLYKLAQKLIKQLPGILNNIKDQLMVIVPQYYELLKMKVLNLYQLYEADLIALLKKIQSDLIMYWNIVKTEAPVLLKNYIEVLKKSETWTVVQTTLNEVMVNYPAYYDAAVDFYNKVIVTYLTDLSETVSQLLVLPEFDVSQYVVVIKQQLSTILNNVVSQFLDTKAVILFQEKFNELKSLYPIEFGLLEDVYTKVLLPTSSQTLAIINKLINVPDLDFQKYLAIVISDVPELLIKISQRVVDTEVVQKLKTTFPVVFGMVVDLYNKVVIPTLNDITAFIQKVTALPVDFEVYLATLQVEVPVLATQLVQRLLDTQIVKELKAAFPTLFVIAEDLYSNVILPTSEDALAVAQKLISLPVLDIQESIKQYWNVIKVEVPTLFKSFVVRLPNTQLVIELKTLLPTLFEVSEDFYNVVVLPTIDDVVAFVDKVVAVPVVDIQSAFTMLLDILKTEAPTLLSKFIQRIPNTQMMNLLQSNLVQISSFLENKFIELKAQFPEVYSVALDIYTKVVVPAVAEVPLLYNTVIQITDIKALGDFVVTDLLSFVNNILKNISTTDIFVKLIAVFDQLVASYPNEYTTLVQTLDQIKEALNQIKEISLINIISTIKTYLLENYGMSFDISAEKITAVLPLPISAAIVRDYYQLITVYAPALVVEALTQYVEQGRLVYQYIEAQVPVVMDIINTQAPIYLQFVKDYVQELQVVVPQIINDIQVKLPEYLAPYVEEVIAMIGTSYTMARKSTYVKLTEKKVRDIIELLFTKFNEVVESYPEEIKAVQDFVILYANICLDYATWAMKTVFEHPTVQKIIGYLQTLTPEKAQADLKPLQDFVMTALTQVQTKFNDLIAVIPKDIPAFVKLHIPAFFLTLIETVIMFLK